MLVVTAPSRSYSIGPVKQAVYAFSTAAADTTGSFTVGLLSIVDVVSVDGGLVLAAAPTIAGNVVTLTFAASPTGGNFGNIVVHGK